MIFHVASGRQTAGLRNREIARELVISDVTAETHVRNILRRLDFTSRSQLAAWFAEREPLAQTTTTPHRWGKG